MNYYLAGFNKTEKATKKDKYKVWALGLKETLLAPYDISKKFLLQINKISELKAESYLEKLLERVNAAKGYFEPILKDFSKKINIPISELSQEKRVKKYITELKDLDRIFYGQLQKIYKAEALIEAVIENTELTKEKLAKVQPEKEQNQISENKEVKKEKKKLKEKKPKIPNHEKSYNLFKQGKSIDEIAGELGFKERTIQGHLAIHVENGDLDILELIPEEKFKKIAEVHKTMENDFLAPIKEVLGDDYSYPEIQFAVAYLKGKREKV
ncbi:MAG: helix-turn-helix domain-containing protein [Bacteroidales bacterium]|nr:helix-turn-helix domain-containing protein [Bacteroidales bacterium]